MRILMIAPGSRGDVQPYIALGKGLMDSGHFIRLISHENYAALVTSYGLDFCPVAGDVKSVVESDVMRKRVEKGNFLSLMAEMSKQGRDLAIHFAAAGLAAARGMDAVLAGMGGLNIGLALAEKMNLPLIQAYVVPFTPTAEFPSVLASKLPALLNRLSHHLTRQLMWQSFRPADTLARRQVLNIPPAPFSGPYQSRAALGMPVLYGFSPSVIPAPSDWDQNTHITGYWFVDEAQGWQPPAALLDFLNSGAPPLYIGFGSMSNRNPEQTADLIIHALAQTGQRAVLLSGWGGLQKTNLPASIFMLDSVPHSWLFPRVSAVIHHGGASTTAAGLRAGVPSLIIPFFGDQPFWGRRVADLGVGAQPIPRKKLTVDNLARAIQELVTNEGMRQRAAELGKRIQSEDGIAVAAEIILRLEK